MDPQLVDRVVKEQQLVHYASAQASREEGPAVITVCGKRVEQSMRQLAAHSPTCVACEVIDRLDPMPYYVVEVWWEKE